MKRKRSSLRDSGQKKLCSKCLVALPLGMFGRDRTKRDGYYPSCRNCRRELYGNIPRTPAGYYKGVPLFKSGDYLSYRGGRLHRYLMEQKLGRKLLRSEHVHHINGNKTDNRIENLAILYSKDHLRFHAIERWRRDMYKVDLTKLSELYRSGFGSNTISKILGIPKEVVYRRLRFLGIDVDRNRRQTVESRTLTEELFGRLRPWS